MAPIEASDYPLDPKKHNLDDLQEAAKAKSIAIEKPDGDGTKPRTKAELADDLNANPPAAPTSTPPDAAAQGDGSSDDPRAGVDSATTGGQASRSELNEHTHQVADGFGDDPLGTEKGYLGGKVDPRPNSEHSLESGPDGVPPREGYEEGRVAAAE